MYRYFLSPGFKRRRLLRRFVLRRSYEWVPTMIRWR
jgi:hypothetical protein